MLDYPNNFDTPAFPAGKRIAVSRAVSILVSALFFVIICLCCLLIWTSRSATVDPFIISVDSVTGTWSVVGHSHGTVQYSASRTMQESVVANFTRDWFTVGDDSENQALWQTCDRGQVCMSENAPARADGVCAIYCATNDSVFNRFIYDVVPTWQDIAAASGRLSLDTSSLQIEPVGAVGNNGGMWRVRATISGNVTPSMQIIAFMRVGRDTKSYPRTLGYYITDFNAYRLN